MSALILSTDAAAGLRRPHADLSAALDDGHEFRYCLLSYSSRPAWARGLKPVHGRGSPA